MKKCRSCQSEIDDKAKKCPHCQTKQGNWIQRHPILTVIIVLVIIGAFGASGGDKTKTDNPSTSTAINEETKVKDAKAEVTPEAKTEFAVGEAIQMEDYALTVNKVTKAASKGYSTPKTGNEYVFVNVTVQNTGDKEVSYNPFDFKIQDSNGNQTTDTFVSLDDRLSSGTLASGGKVTGSLSFEAPKSDKGLKLIYQPNVWLDNARITINLQ